MHYPATSTLLQRTRFEIAKRTKPHQNRETNKLEITKRTQKPPIFNNASTRSLSFCSHPPRPSRYHEIMGPFAYRSWVEISLQQIADNFNAVRSVVGPAVEVMPVVKADATGTGRSRSPAHSSTPAPAGWRYRMSKKAPSCANAAASMPEFSSWRIFCPPSAKASSNTISRP